MNYLKLLTFDHVDQMLSSESKRMSVHPAPGFWEDNAPQVCWAQVKGVFDKEPSYVYEIPVDNLEYHPAGNVSRVLDPQKEVVIFSCHKLSKNN